MHRTSPRHSVYHREKRGEERRREERETDRRGKTERESASTAERGETYLGTKREVYRKDVAAYHHIGITSGGATSNIDRGRGRERKREKERERDDRERWRRRPSFVTKLRQVDSAIANENGCYWGYDGWKYRDAGPDPHAGLEHRLFRSELEVTAAAGLLEHCGDARGGPASGLGVAALAALFLRAGVDDVGPHVPEVFVLHEGALPSRRRRRGSVSNRADLNALLAVVAVARDHHGHVVVQQAVKPDVLNPEVLLHRGQLTLPVGWAGGRKGDGTGQVSARKVNCR